MTLVMQGGGVEQRAQAGREGIVNDKEPQKTPCLISAITFHYIGLPCPNKRKLPSHRTSTIIRKTN